MRHALLAVAALALSGCATTYQMTLMPRDSGKTYTGLLEEAGSGEGRITVNLDGKAYAGTWVQSTPASTHGWVSGGFGWGRADKLGRAQNAALKACYKEGGKECVIRTFFCDAKG